MQSVALRTFDSTHARCFLKAAEVQNKFLNSN